jgi:hypothetical protein
MDSNSILGILAIVTSIIIPVNLFLMKQITDIKKSLSSLCERIAKEETKSDIYHGGKC